MTLQEQLDQAAEGSVVRIPAGTHAVNVRITRSVTLLGDSATTILDGGGRGSVVQIDAPQATVKLVGLVLQNGDGHAGGAVLLKRGKLELTECVLRQNRAMGFGGGALYSSGQALHVERCQLLGNEALQGGGVLLDGPQRATFTSTLIAENRAKRGGGLRIREGADAELVGCTVAANRATDGETAQVELAGTMTRTPSLTVRDSILWGEGRVLFNDGEYKGTVSGSHLLLPETEPAEGLSDVVRGDPKFRGTGTAPFALDSKSPAVGRGSAGNDLGAISLPRP